MDSKYCSGCYQKRSLSSFAKNGSTDKLLASCTPCRISWAKSNIKRKALQLLDPNKLLFEGPFDYERFTGRESAVSQDRELDYTFRNTQLL